MTIPLAEPPSRPVHRSHALAQVALAAALGAAAHALSAEVVPSPALPSPCFAAGVVAALLLRSVPRRRWLVVATCGLAPAVAVDVMRGAPPGVALAAMAGALAETLVAALSARLVLRGERTAATAQAMAILLGAATFLGSGAHALVSSSLRHLLGGERTQMLPLAWVAAHAFGLALTLPLGASKLRWPVLRASWRGAATVALVASAAWAIFLSPRDEPHLHPYLLAPALVITAFQFEVTGAAIAGLAMGLAAAFGTVRGLGEFATRPGDPEAMLEAFLVVGLTHSSNIVLATSLEAARSAGTAALRSARRAEALLHEFELFLRHAPLPIYVKDSSSRFLAVSAALAEVAGKQRPDLIGRGTDAVWPPCIAARLRAEDVQVLASGTPFRSTFEYGGRSYLTVKFPLGAGPTGRIGGFLVDLTDRRQAEQSLRLASLGTLASGVAHEVNNPLAAIVSNVSFIEHELKSCRGCTDEEHRAELCSAAKDAAAGASRVAHIVKQLRYLASNDGTSDVVAPTTAVETALDLVREKIAVRARVQVRLGPAPLVAVSRRDLAQAIVNVLVNAADSIPPSSRAEHCISIDTSTDADGWAVIDVHDSGRGISADELQRVFDPFFTTKDVGAGLGLGLAVARSIVTRVGGAIEVTSEPGAGTTVRIQAPPAELRRREAAQRAHLDGGSR